MSLAEDRARRTGSLVSKTVNNSKASCSVSTSPPFSRSKRTRNTSGSKASRARSASSRSVSLHLASSMVHRREGRDGIPAARRRRPAQDVPCVRSVGRGGGAHSGRRTPLGSRASGRRRGARTPPRPSSPQRTGVRRGAFVQAWGARDCIRPVMANRAEDQESGDAGENRRGRPGFGEALVGNFSDRHRPSRSASWDEAQSRSGRCRRRMSRERG